MLVAYEYHSVLQTLKKISLCVVVLDRRQSIETKSATVRNSTLGRTC